MEYLISAVSGYLFGSFPTAYLLLKRTKGIDITNTGSGNVGAMNSYEVTNSKVTGIMVLIIDAVKGIASVFFIKLLYPDAFGFAALALVFAVFSHCYNPWINFKGGRGLATAAGGAAIMFPFVLAAWLLLWVITFIYKRDILLSNIAATILSLMITYSSANIAVKYAFPKPGSESELMLFATGILLVIFIKHIDPLKELLKEKKIFQKRNDNVQEN
ncbi:MAG: glycerol-3-phosphate acyltransferase [Ignavibacteriales bacterium]|nr:MAG: glycerol-3-phosphate acyltransferase [Ignavibacteriales bacterium]